MRKYLAFLVVLMFCTCCAAQDAASQADRYLKKYANQGKFMGSVIVSRAGKVLFERSYGMADMERDVPNTPQTKFNIASLTKQFTGLAVLQLAERGKLALEDPVSKYYADAPPAWKEITIYQLLTHTSGIPNPERLTDYPKGIAQAYTPRELVAIFETKALDFPPGTKRKYSNPGYYLLGYIIERVSGQAYADYIRQTFSNRSGCMTPVMNRMP
jgi:CubicO group peptidase (beta-lactamase class C family)